MEKSARLYRISIWRSSRTGGSRSSGQAGAGSQRCARRCAVFFRGAAEAQEPGKSLLNGFDPATAPIAEVAEAIGVLFQDPDAQLVQGIVEDEAAFGPENMRVSPAEIEERVVQSLTAVESLERRKDPVRDLSGGQRRARPLPRCWRAPAALRL